MVFQGSNWGMLGNVHFERESRTRVCSHFFRRILLVLVKFLSRGLFPPRLFRAHRDGEVPIKKFQKFWLGC